MPTVSAVIVSYADAAATQSAVASLQVQSVAPAHIVVVDNMPSSRLSDLPGTTVLRADTNLGYTAAANLGARETSGDWLFLLNPDAAAAPDCIEQLLDGADDRTGIVGAQVLLPDGRVNAGDNPLHITGVSWSGRYLQPAEDGPARSVACVSGAALLVRRAAWEQVGGLSEHFFLYHDDADISWRVRLAGWDVRFQPRARVSHQYDFDKGSRKWFWLERNRAWMVLCNYDALTLLVLAPALLAAEIAILGRAMYDGWLLEKLRAWCAVAGDPTLVISRRREVQATRRIGDSELLARMTGSFSTPVMKAGVAGWFGPVLERYRRLASQLVR